MKQLIVMVSMIMLGIAISGLISSFSTNAETMAHIAQEKMTSITNSMSTARY